MVNACNVVHDDNEQQDGERAPPKARLQSIVILWNEDATCVQAQRKDQSRQPSNLGNRAARQVLQLREPAVALGRNAR